MAIEHVKAGAGSGDDDKRRTERGGASGRVRLARNCARSRLQRAGTHPASDPTLPLPQVFFEAPQCNVTAISPPGEPKSLTPWRGKHVGLISAKIDEIDPLVIEPLHQPAAVLRDRACQILARKALAAGLDLAQQDIL